MVHVKYLSYILISKIYLLNQYPVFFSLEEGGFFFQSSSVYLLTLELHFNVPHSISLLSTLL